MSKIPSKIIASLLIGLVIGFFVGFEFKAYQIRSAFKEVAESISGSSNENQSVLEQAEEENYQTIEKNIGDEIILATIKLKANKVDEQQTISSTGTPKVASAGSKFLIVNLTVTNITNSPFTFAPDDGLRLVDSKNREFKTYSNTIGSIENYLDYKEIAPNVSQTGVVVYEVPSDATSYSLVISKGGTTELYKIKLK